MFPTSTPAFFIKKSPPGVVFLAISDQTVRLNKQGICTVITGQMNEILKPVFLPLLYLCDES